MQSRCPCLDRCHRLSSVLALALTRTGLTPASRSRAGRLRAYALPVIANAWVAAMGQPSPMSGFALVVMAELGSILLRLPAVRSTQAAAQRSMAFVLAALTFQLAAARHAMAAAAGAGRPWFVLQSVSNVKQPQARAGYHSVGGRPQSNMQHPPRRTS